MFTPFFLKSIRCALFVAVISLFMPSCSFGSSAPKSIREYEIAVLTKKSTKIDEKYLNKVTRYVFNKNGSYISYLNGSTDLTGDYSYRRVSKNKGQIELSYNNGPYGVDAYVMILTFTDEKFGYWEGSVYEDPIGSEKGTFTVLKSPS